MNNINDDLKNLIHQLSPENQDRAIKLLIYMERVPGFFDAYKALPKIPGYECPSMEDVEVLMAEWDRKAARK